MQIAIDAAGGDYASRSIVDGALVAARHLGFDLTLVGGGTALEAELARHDTARVAVRVLDAPDVVEMHEAPRAALRKKPLASVRVAAETVARGDAAAFFSAGHTGATLLPARAVFGLLRGVDRPALAATIPTRRGEAVLLDAWRHGRVPTAAFGAVCRHGTCVCAGLVGDLGSTGGAPFDWARGEQGQRPDSRSASTALSEGVAVYRQRGSA
jgi:hypothetical protein